MLTCTDVRQSSGESDLLSLEEGDAGVVSVPPLLEVVHHHGRHGPGETAHRRLEGQVACADDGDVEDAVFLLHRVGALLKLHAGNWEGQVSERISYCTVKIQLQETDKMQIQLFPVMLH